tara:strand:- start:1091 stop:1297 length:207 start_codon:yes stop_codon:yes gene_type:complete
MFAIKFRLFSKFLKKTNININNINSINSIVLNKKNLPQKSKIEIIKHNLSESHSSKPYIKYKTIPQNN